MPIQLPSWSQTKTTSKQGFDKVYNFVDKLGPPINKLSNKVGSEAFWPTTLDIESDKAARILRSFCRDGFYLEEPDGHIPAGEKARGKAKVVKKIPSDVIRKAKGLAIFTIMRTGLWVSGAGGSGILVGRTADGRWSPPSGIMLHTAGLGFLAGVDIYDCVLVINTEKAMEAFSSVRCTLGGEVSAVAGPLGAGAVLETEVHKRQAPVWTYLKSRGFYAGVQVDGTIVIERTDENERFYGERINVADILAGKARHPPYEIRTLMTTIEAAQGDTVDESVLLFDPTPGDTELEKFVEPDTNFGLPAEDDPDPFGVRALEAEGMKIREAGSGSRPSLEAFQYKPAPSSPIYNSFRRHSMDNNSRRNSKRDSARSVASIDRGTQTAGFTTSAHIESPRTYSPMEKTTESHAEEEAETNGVEDHGFGQSRSQVAPIMEQAAPQPVISKARLVTIPKRVPPALPPRSPYRQSARVLDAEPSTPPMPIALTEHYQPDISITVPSSTPYNPQFANISLHDSVQEDISPQSTLVRNPNSIIYSSPSRPTSSGNPNGTDSTSLSGSDYSHAQSTPAPTPGVGNDGDGMIDTPITLDDQEANGVEVSKDHDQPPESSKMRREESQTSEKMDEMFHSVPGTPVERSSGA